MSNHQQQQQNNERKPLPSLVYPTPKERLQHQELLASPRRTNVDKIRTEGLLPSGDPLPNWKDFPLDKKFPVIPANPGVFGFSRRGIGEELFPPKDGPFDTNDPLMQATPTGYEALHDPHLKEYIKQHPELRERMAKEGVVEEPGGGVLSSMKDWNIYRNYLGRKDNLALGEGLKGEDALRKKERDQLNKFQRDEKREQRREKDMARKELIDSVREEKERRGMFAQIKGDELLREHLDQRDRDLTRKIVKREALREQVRGRIQTLRKAERKKARRIIIEWYCRQLYADMMRKALRDHKKALKEADLDSFVSTKRELQEKKRNYLMALEDKRCAEQECRLNRRIAQFEKLHQKHDLKKKVDKEARDLEIVRKFAMRWLNFVRNQKKQASSYHDSVWRVRQQLVEMVKGLKNETGRVSFTSFIKGLVRLKPGREKEPEMTEETREIMNYILDLLIKAAFDTYKKRNHPCKNAYEKQSNRRKILGQPDRQPEEFDIPPRYVTREKPKIEFKKPTFPCGSACVGRRQEWEEDPCCKDHTCDDDYLEEAEDLVDEEMQRLFGDKLKKEDGSSSGDSSLFAEGLSRTALNQSVKDICKEKGDGECPTGSDRSGKGKGGKGRKGGDTTDDGSSVAAERLVTKSITNASKDAGKGKHGEGKSPRSGGSSPRDGTAGSGKGLGWGSKAGAHDKDKGKGSGRPGDKKGPGDGKHGHVTFGEGPPEPPSFPFPVPLPLALVPSFPTSAAEESLPKPSLPADPVLPSFPSVPFPF